MKQIIENRTGLKLKELNKNAKHEMGKTYYNGYWCDTYTVIDYTENTNDWMLWRATCEWSDGHITTHCTSLDYRYDFEVIV